MPIPPQVVKCFKHIDYNKKNYIEELRKIIKIQNVSSHLDAKHDLSTMIIWMHRRLKKLGFKVQLFEPDYKKHKGNKPFIILAHMVTDPNKRTLLYYCHLDVLQVVAEKWATSPFELTEKNGSLYGRGTAKMKGPLLCFIHAVESYINLGLELPINIKIICVVADFDRGQLFHYLDQRSPRVNKAATFERMCLLCFSVEAHLPICTIYALLSTVGQKILVDGGDVDTIEPQNLLNSGKSMFECGSKGLVNSLMKIKANFLSNVDCILITDSHWLGSQFPCLVYGTRGVCYFNLSIEGANQNLCSGDYGGVVYEPMDDLLNILGSIIQRDGTIQIPNFYDDVIKVTPDEEEIYEKIKVSTDEYRNNVGVYRLGHKENMKTLLMYVWRHPWFNLHFINSSCDDVDFLHIPNRINCRFSIRFVPNQSHEKLSKMTIDYVYKCVEDLKTPNKISIYSERGLDPWCENNKHWSYQAAGTATKQVYKTDVSLIHEGNGFPILLKIRKALPKKNILVMPIVDSQAMAHCHNENISIRCYIEGTKLLASYFYELSVVSRKPTTEENQIKHICRDKLSSF